MHHFVTVNRVKGEYTFSTQKQQLKMKSKINQSFDNCWLHNLQLYAGLPKGEGTIISL